MKTALPRHWRILNLEDVAASIPNAIVDGPFGSNLKVSDYIDEGVPVLQGKNISNDSFKWFDVRFISPSKADELKRSSVRVDDILIVKIGSIGYSAILDDLNGFDYAIIPANLAKVSPNLDKVHLRYLHRWLTSAAAKRYLLRAASKTAQPALSLAKIKKLPVPLPPLAEQRRIAEILDKADAVRAKRRVSLAQLESLTQSIFLELFGDPTVNSNGWPKVQLREVCDNITDGTHDTPARVASGVPFITSKNIRPFDIDLSELEFVSPETHQEIIRRCNPRSGDVLYTNIGVNVGNAVANRMSFEFSLKNVALIQPDFEKLDSRFLESLLNFGPFKESILNVSSIGGAQKFIPLKVLRNVTVVIPPIALQREFGRRVAAVEKLKAEQRASLEEMDALFASLQHRAFNGQL